MGVVTVTAAEITAEDAGGIEGVFSCADKGVLNVANVNVASAAGDTTSTINLARFKPGKYRINLCNSRLVNDAWGASVTLAFGLSAYVNQAGATVNASTTAIKAATSVASAGSVALYTDGAVAYKDVYSSTPFYITATVGGAAMTDSHFLSGVIAYQSL